MVCHDWPDPLFTPLFAYMLCKILQHAAHARHMHGTCTAHAQHMHNHLYDIASSSTWTAHALLAGATVSGEES